MIANTDDGMADGQERCSSLYSTNSFKKIAEDIQEAQYTMQIVKMRVVVGPIDNIHAHVDIIHPRIGDLRVLAAIPLLGVQNSALGPQPITQFWQYLANTIVKTTDFLWKGLVSVAGFFYNIATTVIDFGLKVLCTLAQAYAQAVKAVVDAVVDAFMEFVDWALNLIWQIANTILSPIFDAIHKLIDSYIGGVQGALGSIFYEHQQTGKVSSSSLVKLATALTGSYFWILFGIGILLSLIDIALLPITLTFGFLVITAASIIISIVVMQIVGSAITDALNTAGEWLWNTIIGLLSPLFEESEPSKPSDLEQTLAAGACIFGTIGMISGGAAVGLMQNEVDLNGASSSRYKLSKMSFVCAILGLTFGLAVMGIEDAKIAFLMGIVSLSFGLSGVLLEIKSCFGLNIIKTIPDMINIVFVGLSLWFGFRACGEAFDRI